METFFAEYSKQLAIAIKDRPEDYGYGPDKLPEVLERMKVAISKSSFNKDSLSFRRTCKALGIPHTYKAISHFIANHV